MNKHKKPASTVTATLTGTSQSMTTIQSHHSVNNNTASNAGTTGKRPAGAFFNHGSQTEYIALSRVADVVGVPGYIITNAISNGSLPIQEISGCKCVAVSDLFRFKDEGGAV